MTKANRLSNENWPPWLHEAWNQERFTPNALGPNKYPDSDGTDELILYQKYGKSIVNFDDYLMLFDGTELGVCDPSSFNEMYEPVINGTI